MCVIVIIHVFKYFRLLNLCCDEVSDYVHQTIII